MAHLTPRHAVARLHTAATHVRRPAIEFPVPHFGKRHQAGPLLSVCAGDESDRFIGPSSLAAKLFGAQHEHHR